MPDMPTNIPPQVLQALQQQSAGMSGGDMTNILAQLAQMSPDELSAALQQLGIQVPPEQLVNAAENWLEAAAGKQAAGGEEDTETATTTEPVAEGDDTEEAPTPTPQVAAGDNEAAEAAPDSESAEGEDAAIPQGARPTGYSPRSVPQASPQEASAPPMPQAMAAGIPSGGGRMPPSAAMSRQAAGGSSQMDALIEAAMAQNISGNPNMPMPSGPRMPRMSPPMPLGPTSQGNIRMRNPASTRSKKRG
jgi:hypothetical protein